MRLDYRAESGLGCPTRDEFESQLTTRLRDRVLDAQATRVVQVTFEAGPDGPTGRVSWSDDEGQLPGERRFESRHSSCMELAQNVAFVVAVQIELLLERERVQGVRPSNPPGTSDRVRTPKNPSGPTRRDAGSPDAGEAPERPTIQLGVGLGVLGVFGSSPSPGVGLTSFAFASWGSLSVEGGFDVTLPSRLQREDGSGFELSTLSGSAAPCVHFDWLSGCLVMRVGQVSVAGFGVDEPRIAHGLLWQTGLRAALTRRLWGPLHGSVHAEGLVNLTQWRVELTQSEVWTSPPIAARLGASVSVVF